MKIFNSPEKAVRDAEMAMNSQAIPEGFYSAFVVVGRDEKALHRFVSRNRLGHDDDDGYLLTYLVSAADRGHAFDLLALYEWVLRDRGYRIVSKGLHYPPRP